MRIYLISRKDVQDRKASHVLNTGDAFHVAI